MISQEAIDRMSGTRQTEKEQQILEVASKSFLEHGFQGTSINAMARKSGISKESIYRYFSSKKALFEAVIAKELADYQNNLQFLDVELARQDLEEALVSTADSILGVVNQDRTLALRRLIFQEATRHPEIGRYYYEIGPEEAYDHLEKIFSMHRGNTDFEPEVLARYFLAMVLHSTLLKRQCGVIPVPDAAEIHAMSETATRDFLRAFFRD